MNNKRELDKRYKPGVDTGAMSFHNVALPLKSYAELIKAKKDRLEDKIQKQELKRMGNKALKKYIRKLRKEETRINKLKNR